MATIVLSPDTIRATMQSEPVRAALRAKAQDVKGRADSIAATEDVEARFWTEEGTRPKGRSYARVLCDNVDQEFGTSKTARRRILARAAEG